MAPPAPSQKAIEGALAHLGRVQQALTTETVGYYPALLNAPLVLARGPFTSVDSHAEAALAAIEAVVAGLENQARDGEVARVLLGMGGYAGKPVLSRVIEMSYSVGTYNHWRPRVLKKIAKALRTPPPLPTSSPEAESYQVVGYTYIVACRRLAVYLDGLRFFGSLPYPKNSVAETLHDFLVVNDSFRHLCRLTLLAYGAAIRSQNLGIEQLPSSGPYGGLRGIFLDQRRAFQSRIELDICSYSLLLTASQTYHQEYHLRSQELDDHFDIDNFNKLAGLLASYAVAPEEDLDASPIQQIRDDLANTVNMLGSHLPSQGLGVSQPDIAADQLLIEALNPDRLADELDHFTWISARQGTYLFYFAMSIEQGRAKYCIDKRSVA